jgi:hypothetical protein
MKSKNQKNIENPKHKKLNDPTGSVPKEHLNPKHHEKIVKPPNKRENLKT